MNGRDWLASLAGPERPAPAVEPATWLDVLVKAEDQPRPAAWLADAMGVTPRSAERYLAAAGGGKGGKGAMPTRGHTPEAARRLQDEITRERQAEADSEAAASRRAEVADLIREIRRIDPGKIYVRSTSDPLDVSSPRSPGWLDNVADGMARVADAWEEEDEDEAERELSATIIARYGKEPSDSRQGLAANLSIVDYDTGIDYA